MTHARFIERSRRAVTTAIKAASLLALASYLTLTLLYVAPTNPLKSYVQGTVMRTVGRYMSQNWSLFAPTPASQNLVLEVAYLTRDQRCTVARGGLAALPDDAWIDLTTPLVAGFHANRLSGRDRFSRPADSAMRQVVGGGAELQPWARACRNGDTVACLVLTEQSGRYREAGLASLQRIASAACSDFFGDCRPISHVAIRIRTEHPVPWSRRNSLDERAIEIESLGIHPRLTGITPPRLYPGIERSFAS